MCFRLERLEHRDNLQQEKNNSMLSKVDSHRIYPVQYCILIE